MPKDYSIPDESNKDYSKPIAEGDEQIDPNAIPQDESSFGENFLKSAVETPGKIAQGITNIPQIVSHPIDSIKNVGSNLKDKYGSWEKIKHTAFTDPVGTALDASLVLDPAGLAADAVGATRLAKGARMAGSVADPIGLAGKGVNAVNDAIAGKFYKSALRDTGKISSRDIPKVANYGRSNKLSFKDADKNESILNNAESGINDQIDRATNSGIKIDPNDILGPYRNLETKLSKGSAPSKYLDKIKPVADEFSSNNPNLMTPREAQDMKRADYKSLKWDKTFQGAPLEDQARRLIAAGHEQEIENAVTQALGTQYPSLADLNKLEGNGIGLRNAIKKAIEEENAGGYVASPNHIPLTPYAAKAMAVKRILAKPTLKSQIAINLDKLGALPISKGLKALRTGGVYTINPDSVPEQ